MNEDFLQFLWQYRLFNESKLSSANGEPIQIINVGTKNSDAGPDFFNARILYNHVEWAGNIEIHINASDWNKHKHQFDPIYNNVILHVVWNNDTIIYNANQQQILTVTLPILYETHAEYLKLYENHKLIACGEKLATLNFPISTYLTSLAVSRLEKKSQFVLHELKEINYHWEETLYRILAYGFGLKVNASSFLMLAKSIPFQIIQKNADNLVFLESVLFGQSGLLPESSSDNYVSLLIKQYHYYKKKYGLTPLPATVWKFSKIHPPSFPTLRIAQWAAFLYKNANNLTDLVQLQSLKKILKKFDFNTSEYWHSHYHFNKSANLTKFKLGKSYIYLIIINCLLPYIFVYSKERMDNELNEQVISMLEQLPPEKNNIIKAWKEFNIIPQNALQSQALIQLCENYCKPRFCLRCNIGTYILLQTKSLF